MGWSGWAGWLFCSMWFMDIPLRSLLRSSGISAGTFLMASPPGLSPPVLWLFLQQISFFLFKYLFIWLCQVLVTACGVFSCGMRTLNCCMWDLVPWPGIEPRTLALGAQSVSQWPTREVPQLSTSLSLLPAYRNVGDKKPLFPSSLSQELADYSLKVKSALWLFLYGPGAKNCLYILKALLKTEQHRQKE